MARSDRTFTARDVIRVYEENLDDLERKEVEEFFGAAPEEGEHVIRFDIIDQFLNDIESLLNNIKVFSPVVLTAVSGIIILFQIRDHIIEVADAISKNKKISVKLSPFSE